MTWRAAAACVGKSDAFYLPQGSTDFTEAEQLCATCPVLAECEADRRTHEQHPVDMHGFRAGRKAEDRKQEWRARHGKRALYDNDLRRRQVALLVEAGYSERNIARQLDINPRSVSRIKAAHREWLALEATG